MIFSFCPKMSRIIWFYNRDIKPNRKNQTPRRSANSGFSSGFALRRFWGDMRFWLPDCRRKFQKQKKQLNFPSKSSRRHIKWANISRFGRTSRKAARPNWHWPSTRSAKSRASCWIILFWNSKKNFFTCYWVPRVQEVAAAHNIPFKVIHITEKETAQNMSVPAQPMHCSGRGNFWRKPSSPTRNF